MQFENYCMHEKSGKVSNTQFKVEKSEKNITKSQSLFELFYRISIEKRFYHLQQQKCIVFSLSLSLLDPCTYQTNRISSNYCLHSIPFRLSQQSAVGWAQKCFTLWKITLRPNNIGRTKSKRNSWKNTG